jgi:hypothetical protein
MRTLVPNRSESGKIGLAVILWIIGIPIPIILLVLLVGGC